MSSELTTIPKNQNPFSDSSGFEHIQRVAKMLCSSSLVPTAYQGNVQNTVIALEMAMRVGTSPLAVMQNLHIIQGRPSWSSPFIIASINTCGRFGKLGFRKSGEGDDYGYEAYAKDKDGNECVGPKVTWKMVKEEGWLSKAGSKWKTMPELMFQYRSAAFFGRLHCPDILMGMHTVEEVIDTVAQTVEPVEPKDYAADRLRLMIQDAKTLEDLNAIEEHVTDDLWDEWAKKRAMLQPEPK